MNKSWKIGGEIFLKLTYDRNKNLIRPKGWLEKQKKMAKYNRNSGKPITKQDVKSVESLACKNTPTRVIGLKIGRTENSVRKIASDNGISLNPVNQSPYNRRKE